MGKRQIRISKHDLHTKILPYIGTELNLVLTGNIVLHGKVLTLENENIEFQDMLIRNHTIAINTIQEVLIDKEADY